MLFYFQNLIKNYKNNLLKALLNVHFISGLTITQNLDRVLFWLNFQLKILVNLSSR